MSKNKITIIIFTIVIALLFSINLILLLLFKNNDSTMLIATVVSGWISGLATLAVGIFAALQSKQYNDSSQTFLKKQFELEQSKSILQSRLLFVDNIKKTWIDFDSACNPLFFAKDVGSLIGKVDIEVLNGLLLKHTALFAEKTSILNTVLNLDYLDSEQKTEVKKRYQAYKDCFNKAMRSENLVLHTKEYYQLFNNILEVLGGEYKHLLEAFSNYIIFLDFDINTSVCHKSNDIEYLKKQYSPLPK